MAQRSIDMGVSERKAREKEELRSLILEGAMKLFAEKGVANVTIRNIADAVEYSVGTVYVYFKDKNAILHALHTKGFLELRGRFMVLLNVADPMERLKASGKVYIQFAQEQPDMYDLMFNTQAPMDFVKEGEGDVWDEGKATFGFVRTVIQDCLAAGHFSGHDPEALSFLIWSIVHGMCSLTISCRTDVVSLEQPTTQGYAEFLRMLEKF
ncbi:MAG TPA: TetR/AcrR family transcriptional regulator [Hymenobacter sp.]|nr:TetR/AcrR family transcriptional regulator [Hymenobacter sp.]HLL95592.1 TetR/AcrR family transcriptional regulator [Spirosoma sp.]